jgi:hypothetical protein
VVSKMEGVGAALRGAQRGGGGGSDNIVDAVGGPALGSGTSVAEGGSYRAARV